MKRSPTRTCECGEVIPRGTWFRVSHPKTDGHRRWQLWKKVVPTDDGCWVWTGRTDGGGYGFIAGPSPSYSPIKVHRLSWQLLYGVIPPKMLVCHTCDNPPCVRPSHLFLGTVRDNARDAVNKGRVGSNPASLANLNTRHGSPS